MGLVDQTVEDRVGKGGVADAVVPVLDGELTGHEGGAAAVAVLEDFEQVAAFAIGERGEAPVVEDHEVGFGQGGEELAGGTGYMDWSKMRVSTFGDALSKISSSYGPNRTWLGSFLSRQPTGTQSVYMRNRYYDPVSGRFTQEDPIGLAGGLNLYGFAGGDPVNFSDPFGLRADSIVVQTHVVLGRWSHASIRITPDDQDAWANDPRFQRGEDGRLSVTLGAEGISCIPAGMCLVSDLNRPTDAAPHSGNTVVDLDGRDENSVIRALLRTDAAYGDNLGYSAFPRSGGLRYNSNSYVSGVLRAAGLNVVAPTGVRLPGWNQPIPIPLPFR
jgi:RHS repeat-associated protein